MTYWCRWQPLCIACIFTGYHASLHQVLHLFCMTRPKWPAQLTLSGQSIVIKVEICQCDVITLGPTHAHTHFYGHRVTGRYPQMKEKCWKVFITLKWKKSDERYSSPSNKRKVMRGIHHPQMKEKWWEVFIALKWKKSDERYSSPSNERKVMRGIHLHLVSLS